MVTILCVCVVGAPEICFFSKFPVYITISITSVIILYLDILHNNFNFVSFDQHLPIPPTPRYWRGCYPGRGSLGVAKGR